MFYEVASSPVKGSAGETARVTCIISSSPATQHVCRTESSPLLVLPSSPRIIAPTRPQLPQFGAHESLQSEVSNPFGSSDPIESSPPHDIHTGAREPSSQIEFTDEFDSSPKKHPTKRKALSLSTVSQSSDFTSQSPDEPIPSGRLRANKSKSTGPTKKELAKLETERRNEERRLLKESIERERANKKRFDEVNRKKVSRSAYASDIIVNMDPESHASELGVELKSLLRALDCQVTKWTKSIDGVGLVRFLRRSHSRYDEEKDIYVPIQEEIVCEKFCVITIEASRLVLVLQTEKSIESHVAEIRKLFPVEEVLYVVEGLHNLLKKSVTERNRELSARVRELMGEKGSRRTGNSGQVVTNIDPKKIFNALIEFELRHNFKVIHTLSKGESAEWISGFAQDIGSRHYKIRELASESGDMLASVRSGSTVSDTLSKSLQHIKYVTPNIADGVAGVYNNMYNLIDSVDKRGPDAFEAIRKTNGSRSTKLVGRTLANAIVTIFGSKDPEQFLD
jgi:hypothetical protein